jgi:hypothetical protein
VTDLDVVCARNAGAADWTCRVTISGDHGTTRHRVGVTGPDLARLDPGARDPHLLVNRSFRFLLQREPASSILGAFDLMEIGRYFPEYEATITRTED